MNTIRVTSCIISSRKFCKPTWMIESSPKCAKATTTPPSTFWSMTDAGTTSPGSFSLLSLSLVILINTSWVKPGMPRLRHLLMLPYRSLRHTFLRKKYLISRVLSTPKSKKIERMKLWTCLPSRLLSSSSSTWASRPLQKFSSSKLTVNSVGKEKKTWASTKISWKSICSERREITSSNMRMTPSKIVVLMHTLTVFRRPSRKRKITLTTSFRFNRKRRSSTLF